MTAICRRRGGAGLLLQWRQKPKRRQQSRDTQTCASSCHARSGRGRGVQRTAGKLNLPWGTEDLITDECTAFRPLCRPGAVIFLYAVSAADVSACMTWYREKQCMALYSRWLSHMSGRGCSLKDTGLLLLTQALGQGSCCNAYLPVIFAGACTEVSLYPIMSLTGGRRRIC